MVPFLIGKIETPYSVFLCGSFATLRTVCLPFSVLLNPSQAQNWKQHLSLGNFLDNPTVTRPVILQLRSFAAEAQYMHLRCNDSHALFQ